MTMSLFIFCRCYNHIISVGIQLMVLTLIYRSHNIDLPLAYWSSSQGFTWPYPLAFLCNLSSSATLTWPS